MSAIVFCALLAVAQPDEKPAPEPPPLTKEQITQIRQLVHRVQERNADVKQALAEKQRMLTRLYAEYELDHASVAQLQEEILAHQRELLTNYHRLQTRLREIVGRERFVLLKRRIDNVLNAPAQKAPADGRSPSRKPNNR